MKMSTIILTHESRIIYKATESSKARWIAKIKLFTVTAIYNIDTG
jgi:hypothetical protein